MQFAISATLFSLALAALGAAVPTANPPTEIVGERSPSKHDDEPYDWNKDWDGKVIPLEEFGEDVTESDNSISKRALGMVYVCPAYDWRPEQGIGCAHVQFTYPNQCIAPSEQYYRYTISGVGPDPGTWCILYTSRNCGVGGSDVFSYPGMGRLDGYWSTWNDKVGSIRCWW